MVPVAAMNQAHRIEPEPPLTWLYLVECLLCLGLMIAALWLALAFGVLYFGPVQ